MAIFRDRSRRIQYLEAHPRRRFVELMVFAAIIALYGILRFIYLFKNYPGHTAMYFIVAIVATSILIPCVNLMFATQRGRDARFRWVALGIFIAALLLGLPLFEGWTSLFPSYTSHHWLEIPLDVGLAALGTNLLISGIRKKLWLAGNQRQRQGLGGKTSL